MISALSKACQVFDDEKYLLAAEKAADFILNKLISKDGKLFHRFREGETAVQANVDDYAFLISSLIDFIKNFWDKKAGGFFFTSKESEEILVRKKEVYDGVVPSGNSIAMLNLLRISRINGNTEYETMASQISKTFSYNLISMPSAFTQTLIALDFAFGPSYEIVIIGDETRKYSNELIHTVRKKYLPNKTLLFNTSNGKDLTEIAPFVSNYKRAGNKSTVYICQDYNCKQPVSDITALENLLETL